MEEYCYEAVRLSSFKDLPKSVPVPSTRLARSGFYYTGNSDEVACFSCGGRLKEWTYGDNPFVRHSNLFPDCPLMKGTETKNVPLFQTDDAISNGNIGTNDDPFPNLARSSPRDHGGNASLLLSNQQALSRSLGISSLEVAVPQITHAGVASGVLSKENTAAPLTPPNISHLPTCIPSWMRNESDRLATFVSWPSGASVLPRDLARAGFFYLGTEDRVACFSCGGRLKEWTYGDNPFVRHSNLFPDCPLTKGTETKNVPLFQTDDAISIYSIGADDDPFPNLATSSPRDHGDNASSLLSRQQALSRSLGISSPEVAITQITPLETNMMTHAGVASGVRSKENTAAPLTPPNTSHLPACVPSRMRNESDRIATFVSWPSGASVRPRDLARAGFFYLGTEDRVQCAFCEGVLRNWELGDQPMQEHRKYLSTCPFVLGLEVGNIPLEEPSTALPLAVSESQRQAVGGGTTGSETSRSTKLSFPCLHPIDATTESTEGVLTARPRHERYATKQARVRTFANWPPSRIPRPEALARAGFFYAGFFDNVKCFFCDGGLRNWEPQDDPWAEHARWFPWCDFVRQCKSPQSQAQAQRAQGAPGNYNVEAREIKARLDTPTVQAVLDMGFRRDTVRQAIEHRLRDIGDDFPSAVSLLDAILKIEDEMNRQTAQGAAAMAVIPQEAPGQQPLVPALAEVPASVATQNTSQTQNSEIKSLLEENKRLKEERICKICMDEEVSVVFLPCGHLVACVQCAPALRNCAICRTAIKGTVRSILN
ncbi:baculoviral IAP repeat-containing protein 2-like [Lingula anatina]|uniref:Baculoviral IAP repeat-containing protein 2-like n=1 Tax=Lingula anatina TaxID=7574 RepID=A0A1S3HWJ8_LINAN|nr:baculoviral IAP repeat-containing protein 2-like [Lingula anatina]|eukprot:XP_013390417.1 baculoviral IAP repeat-containing protein 2-like [Lingula anatina]